MSTRSKNADSSPKKTCAIKRAEFREHARPIEARLAWGDGPGEDVEITLTPKEFSTNSFGWAFSGKLELPVNGTKVVNQGSFNVVVAHSANAE